MGLPPTKHETIRLAPSSLPEWLYEALPIIYAVAGLMSIFFIGNVIAVASGGLLLSAAALVAYMRVEYRCLPNIERSNGISRRTAGGRLPAWLYESLPFLYVGCGIITPMLLQGFPAIVASVMLVWAGIAVFGMRRRYRRAVLHLRRRTAIIVAQRIRS